MATTNLNLSYRPIRIGFLVKHGMLDDLIKAASINSLLCGGIFNPIIPVGDNDRFSEQLIEVFSCDILHKISQTDEIKAFFDKFDYLKSPHYEDDIFYKRERETDAGIRYLDVLNLIQYNWDKEFKFATEPATSNCALIKWAKGDNFSNLFPIVWGKYLDAFQRFEDAFLKGLRADKVIINKEDNIDSSLLHRVTPITFTEDRITQYGHSHWDSGLYIGDENSFNDLLTFWNLRAAGSSIVFYPISNSDRWLSFAQAHIENLDKIPDRYPNAPDMVVFYYSNEAHIEEVKKIAARFTTKKDKIFSRCQDVSWNGLNISPSDIRYESKSVLASVDWKYNHHTVSFDLPELNIISKERRDLYQQTLAVSIRPLLEYDYPDHTLLVPYIRRFNDFYGRSITLNPWEFRVERDGIAKLIKATDNSVNLNPISHQSIINKVFESASIKTSLSKAGHLAYKIVENIGGFGSIYVFKIRGVRDLLNSLKASDAITHGEASKIIYKDGMVNKFEKIYLEEGGKKRKGASDFFEFLLKKNIFRAGLELSCDNCKLTSWLSLKDIDDLWSCNYCGLNNLTSIQLKHRGDWKFRLSGLFSKDNNQEGAIPVLLTLQALTAKLGGLSSKAFYTYSMDLSFDSTALEIDFCILSHAERSGEGKIEIGLAECKNGGGQITTDDIAKMKKVREKLTKCGFDCFLIFSKTADCFAPDEIMLFRELNSGRVPIILLSNKELESLHDIYEEYKGKKLPRDYAHSLSDMAWNSRVIYLE